MPCVAQHSTCASCHLAGRRGRPQQARGVLWAAANVRQKLAAAADGYWVSLRRPTCILTLIGSSPLPAGPMPSRPLLRHRPSIVLNIDFDGYNGCEGHLSSWSFISSRGQGFVVICMPNSSFWYRLSAELNLISTIEVVTILVMVI